MSQENQRKTYQWNKVKFLQKNARQVLAVIVVGFLALTVLIMVFPSSWVDLEFSEEIQEHHNHLLDFLMKAITWFGLMYSSILTVTVSSIILFVAKKRRAAYFCFATLLIG